MCMSYLFCCVVFLSRIKLPAMFTFGIHIGTLQSYVTRLYFVTETSLLNIYGFKPRLQQPLWCYRFTWESLNSQMTLYDSLSWAEPCLRHVTSFRKLVEWPYNNNMSIQVARQPHFQFSDSWQTRRCLCTTVISQGRSTVLTAVIKD